jgi:hypothetical protein
MLSLMVVTNFEKSFDTGKVLRLLGAGQGQQVSAASMRRIDTLAQDMPDLLQPRISYRRLGLTAVKRNGIELEGGARFKSPKLSKVLAKAEAVYCFVATVGPAIEMEVQRRMQQRRYADAYVLDAMGSMSAENVVEQFYQRTARNLAKSGQGVTLRFSPGYCDWPLDQQRPLFELFTDHPSLKVKLSRSCLMSPRKSVSGLFGILPAGIPGVHPAYNPCSTCGKHNCIARRSH